MQFILICMALCVRQLMALGGGVQTEVEAYQRVKMSQQRVLNDL